MIGRVQIKSLIIVFSMCFLTAACSIGVWDSNGVNRDLEKTISYQGTALARLSTQAAEGEQTNVSQWDAISYLATQMPYALELITPIPPGTTLIPTSPPTIETPTPYPVCTPPACALDEMYYCPGECPGGCGTTCATPTPGISPESGEVWGKICFPSESIPPMTLYFQNTSTLQTLSFPIEENQTSYQYELPAGVYNAFAWLPDREFGGSYSEYVLCGGGANCTDHSLVPFLVQEDRVTTGVDICDWHGDTGLIPPVPGE